MARHSLLPAGPRTDRVVWESSDKAHDGLEPHFDFSPVHARLRVLSNLRRPEIREQPIGPEDIPSIPEELEARAITPMERPSSRRNPLTDSGSFDDSPA